MRTWTRAGRDGLCGGCGALIRVGDPLLLLTFLQVRAPKRRCRACAGEPVPDLPAAVEPGRRTPRMVPLQTVMTRDKTVRTAGEWKRKQSGEREVGADDE